MLTKYTLEIDGVSHELPTTCLKNWDEVCCAYKRTEFSGVMRTFTSQFEFVNEAYDMLLRLYQRDGVYATAILTLYTITDRWEWEERFSTRLDFSTIVMNDYVLTCHALNAGLSTMIKANKNTKYEFSVGEEVPTDKTLNYDRIQMKNSLEYFIAGEGCGDMGAVKCPQVLVGSEYYLPFYVKHSEIGANGAGVQYFDQPENREDANGPHFLTVKKAVKLRLFAVCSISQWSGLMGVIDDIVVAVIHTDSSNNFKEWIRIGCTNGMRGDESWDIDMAPGDKLSVALRCSKPQNIPAVHYCDLCVTGQKFKFEWEDRAEAVDIDTIKPATLCEKLLEKISNNTLKINCHFSEYDPRLENVSLLAAESIRDIENAKVYSSFNEFCDFMRAVFGYTYYLGDVKRYDSGFQNEVMIDHRSSLPITTFPWTNEYGWPAEDDFQIALYDGPNGPVCGVVCADNKIHTSWPGSEAYNDPATNVARENILFRTPYFYGYYVENGTIQTVELGDNRDSQDIYFVHQSEMLPNSGVIRKIHNVRELSYKADEKYVYSEVNIGYKKHNYDNFNGRGEFNFTNNYSTGYQTTEKKLSIISPYRADCYGIEFACQKRSRQTTDSASDKDVFIIHTVEIDGQLVPDRSLHVAHAFTDSVFNAALSPLACIEANEAYINMQKKGLRLEYASSDGYSIVTIGDKQFTKNFILGEPLVTYGRLEFLTDDVDTVPTATEIIEVESHGIKYRGYLESATFRFAVEEEVHYNLLVKEIEVCY